ncbi:MAG TPA: BlaI/MecI/CopY family transcriptional regulator [Gemmatimonadaceae bacterium]|nr:BlaI/MecI/CopY family transcriptional regulator [Gemmatimonadaceae bacterium]
MRITFTERELDIMAVLWERGPSTAGEVRELLEADLAYNTVLSMLRILEDKGHVGHTEDGRAHRYFPKVDREAAGASALERLVEKIFGGSAELLMSHLVKDRTLDAAELRRIRRSLDERLDGEGAGS